MYEALLQAMILRATRRFAALSLSLSLALSLSLTRHALSVSLSHSLTLARALSLSLSLSAGDDNSGQRFAALRRSECVRADGGEGG